MDTVDDRSHVQWRLTVVAFADVAGFTRLMAADDAGTVELWTRVQSQVLMPGIERHQGRLLEMPGDAVLVEFASAVQAVNWAIEVQEAMRAGDYRTAAGQALQLRIGMNVDEAIEEEGALFSSGINIASRIHHAARPGEIVLTGLARELVGNRAPVKYRDLGTPALKNVSRPVRLFAVERDVRKPGDIAPGPYLRWNSRPTLAVLPFRMIGGTEEDRYFGEGITEDIITGVSRSRALFVIARNSTLRFEGADQDPREVAEALGVRYVLTGSVRRSNDRLRIHAELVEGAERRTLWAERYDGGSEDVFAFQDRIAGSIVASLEPNVRAAETAQIGNRPTDSLDAYDCVLKAISLLYRFTAESYAESETLLRRAVSLDPNYSQAHAYLAWRMNFWIGEGHSDDMARDTEVAVTAARRATELDGQDAFALAVNGHVTSFLERAPAAGADLLDRALRLDENMALAWALSAATQSYLGEGDEARERMRNVWRLSPYDQLDFFFWIVAGIAEFVSDRHEEALVWLQRARRANPRFVASLRMLAATLALVGEEEEARQIGTELLAVEPGFKVSRFVSVYPIQRRRSLEMLEKGLLGAGLPA